MIKTLLSKILANSDHLKQNRAILLNKQAKQLSLLEPLL